jgi:hypothetical protein
MISRFANTFAISFTLALVAGGAAEARGGGYGGGGFSVSRQPVPVVRDHGGPMGSGGGVMVTNTPGKFGGYGRGSIIRDHRAQPIVRDHRTVGVWGRR